MRTQTTTTAPPPAKASTYISAASQAITETAIWHVATAPQDRGRPSLLNRFMANVRLDGDCWLWTKTLNQKGYAPFYVTPRCSPVAHRWIYTLLIGDIPEGLQLDHLCRRRSCVNPWHLEPVTNRENQRRGEHLSTGITVRTNRCKRGHSMADAYVIQHRRRGGSQRLCRPCQQERYAAYIQRKRAA